MSLLGRIFAPRRGATDVAFKLAMVVSGDLIHRMRERPSSSEVARSVVADVWERHRNIPFMTSVYETVQEMKVVRSNGGLPRALPK
jgi:hypothetical protein